jgi:hypothetical protein
MTDEPPGTEQYDVDLYVRPSQLGAALDDHVAELNELTLEGVVSRVAVNTWPNKVPMRSPDTEAVERFHEFRQWADANDVNLQPPFTVRTLDSSFTGEVGTYLWPPVMCMAVRARDALVGVYPHTTGEDHLSVVDGIEALHADDFAPHTPLEGETGTSDARQSSADVAPPADEACPDCDGQVVNVQGIVACHRCAWVDVAPPPTRPFATPARGP